MDKIHFLWLQKISSINKKMNLEKYINEIYKYNEDIIEAFNNTKSILKDSNLDLSIVECLLDKNIIENTKCEYNNIIKSGYKIVTIEDREYPRKMLENKKGPFCYIASCNIDLNNKNVCIYYNDYFSKYAKNLVSYFGKIACEENANVLTQYKNSKIECLNILSYEDMKSNIILSENKYIFLPFFNIEEFELYLIDILVIVEARYEEKIIKLVDEMAKSAKEVLVVPSTVFNKNSYFSNYLIKQGADVLLNKWDLKFVLKRLIS